jgi:trimeric autotransporter adhesin
LNTTGNNNTAHGVSALFSNTTGNDNTANGYRSLFSNTSGYSNVAIGVRALFNNTSQSNLVAIGDSALFSNTTGLYNTAVGSKSLFSNTGFNNTAIGYHALYSNVAGNSNSALGYLANTGNFSNATAIGANSQADCSNCLVLGSVNTINGATSNVNVGIGETNPGFPLNFSSSFGDKISVDVNSGDHSGFGIQPQLFQMYTRQKTDDIVFGWGNSFGFNETMRIQGNGNAVLQGTLTQLSDVRLKKDISPIQNSLQKIIQLNGYSYHWKNEQSDSSLQIGVLAQEVQKLFPDLVKEDSKGMLSVNYSGLIPVLIESVKEQQQLIEKQQKQIDDLKKLVDQLIKK